MRVGDVAGSICQAWQILLATSQYAIQLKMRGFKFALMTWRAMSADPARVQMRVDDVAGNGGLGSRFEN